MTQVRNWLNGHAKRSAASPTRIWAAFNEFMSDNDAELARLNFSRQEIEKLPVDELMHYMTRWIDTANTH